VLSVSTTIFRTTAIRGGKKVAPCGSEMNPPP
jgi:hypothetical protein